MARMGGRLHNRDSESMNTLLAEPVEIDQSLDGRFVSDRRAARLDYVPVVISGVLVITTLVLRAGSFLGGYGTTGWAVFGGLFLAGSALFASRVAVRRPATPMHARASRAFGRMAACQILFSLGLCVIGAGWLGAL